MFSNESETHQVQDIFALWKVDGPAMRLLHFYKEVSRKGWEGKARREEGKGRDGQIVKLNVNMFASCQAQKCDISLNIIVIGCGYLSKVECFRQGGMYVDTRHGYMLRICGYLLALEECVCVLSILQPLHCYRYRQLACHATCYIHVFTTCA